jgi:hypothetical protein
MDESQAKLGWSFKALPHSNWSSSMEHQIDFYLFFGRLDWPVLSANGDLCEPSRAVFIKVRNGICRLKDYQWIIGSV